MDKYYKCDCCKHSFKEDDIETVNDNTGASDGTVDLCPVCHVPESFSSISDLDWKMEREQEEFENREEDRLDSMFDARYDAEDLA